MKTKVLDNCLRFWTHADERSRLFRQPHATLFIIFKNGNRMGNKFPTADVVTLTAPGSQLGCTNRI